MSRTRSHQTNIAQRPPSQSAMEQGLSPLRTPAPADGETVPIGASNIPEASSMNESHGQYCQSTPKVKMKRVKINVWTITGSLWCINFSIFKIFTCYWRFGFVRHITGHELRTKNWTKKTWSNIIICIRHLIRLEIALLAGFVLQWLLQWSQCGCTHDGIRNSWKTLCICHAGLLVSLPRLFENICNEHCGCKRINQLTTDIYNQNNSSIDKLLLIHHSHPKLYPIST